MGYIPDLSRVNGFAYKPGELLLSPNSPMISAKRLLADRYTTDEIQLLYRHRGAFYCWQSSHYHEITDQYLKADINLFLDCAQRISENKEGKQTKIPFHPKRVHVGEIMGALESLAYLGDILQPPFWLGDRVPDLDPTELLACANGLLHLPTHELLKHTPTFFTHNAIDYSYDPRAPQPLQWFGFLRELWPTDDASILALQEWFGYCLVADTSYQKAFMLVGPKRSGKGTIARVLEAVIGPHNAVSPTLASLAGEFGLAPLIGKRLAIISDARISTKTDTAVVAERLLSITGEDSVSANRKFLAHWRGKLEVRFLVLSNELPRIADASGALPSRFIVLMLTNSFFGKEDRGLTARLLGERSGILNWAIAGYERLSARGYFQQPESAADAIRDLEDLGSPISAFLRDKCIIAPGRAVACSDLFDEWKLWSDSQNQGNAGTLQTFGRDIRSAVPGLRTINARSEDGRSRVYDGIGIQRY